ncbi:MAG: DUF547 domain-containing protein [Myxococcota bacterium]
MNSIRRIESARIAAVVATAAALASAFGASGASAIDLDLYARTLEQYSRDVDETAGTRVDYRGLRMSADWSKLVESLEASELSRLRSTAQKKAFWINAYNILAIDRVVHGEPEHSIRDLGSLFRSVWKQPAGTIDGRPVTLHQIEHEIRRPMGDPRIHAAIVCASTSCPSLLREPWTAEQLEDQFDRSLRRWLADPDKGVSIDRASNTVRLSRIFKWFRGDFDPSGGVTHFVAGYLTESDARWLRAHADTVDIDYLDYDWTLNRLPDR